MKFAVYSHCTIDTIVLGTSTYKQIGGAACYCALCAKNFKSDVEVFTKFGPDFPKEFFSEKEIQCNNALSEKLTTKFKITIKESDRVLSFENSCEPIPYSKTDADAVVISPVYHEIGKNTYEKIKNDSGFVLLDPQGFLRKTDSQNNIVLEKTSLDLSKISAIKVSPDELFCLSNDSQISAMKSLQKKGIEHVIVTNKRDISMLVKDRIYSIKLPNLELYDTTGIGDIFCSTFSCTMIKEKDFFWALCFAGGAAQAAIETKEVGLQKVPSKGAVETNAAYFYNQVKFKQI